jgi:hypothetical protein
MKRILFLFLLSILCKTIYSQPFGDSTPGYKLMEIQYENSSGEKGITNFKYDQQGKLIKGIWSLNDNSRHSVNYYIHDSIGNLISAFRDFSDGLSSFEKFDYDTTGNKVSECFYRSDSIFGSALYEYNNGQLIQANFINHKGWLNGKLVFEYKADRKEKGILYKERDVVCEVYYNYDSIGNLIKEFWDFNGKWSQTFYYTYKKKKQPLQFYSSPFLSNKSNLKINKESYTFNNEIGGPSLYYYDEKGLLSRKLFIRNDSLTTNTFYLYDSEDKLVTSKRVYSDSSIAVFTYTYDDNKNLIFRNFFRADTLYGFESYLYNSENTLTKAYLKNYDGWLSGIINFKSDELGKTTTGQFIGEDGFNASIYFLYNQENLVSKIRWEFSFGKYQEYDFEYINLP